MDWSNLGYLVFFGVMAFMMFRGGGCCGGGHDGGQSGTGHTRGSHGGCCGGGSVSESHSSKKVEEKSTTTNFVVEGMTCQHCAGTVEKALLGKQGVSAAKVSLVDKKVEVAFNPAIINVEALKKVVGEAGYEAK